MPSRVNDGDVFSIDRNLSFDLPGYRDQDFVGELSQLNTDWGDQDEQDRNLLSQIHGLDGPDEEDRNLLSQLHGLDEPIFQAPSAPLGSIIEGDDEGTSNTNSSSNRGDSIGDVPRVDVNSTQNQLNELFEDQRIQDHIRMAEEVYNKRLGGVIDDDPNDPNAFDESLVSFQPSSRLSLRENISRRLKRKSSKKKKDKKKKDKKKKDKKEVETKPGVPEAQRLEDEGTDSRQQEIVSELQMLEKEYRDKDEEYQNTLQEFNERKLNFDNKDDEYKLRADKRRMENLERMRKSGDVDEYQHYHKDFRLPIEIDKLEKLENKLNRQEERLNKREEELKIIRNQIDIKKRELESLQTNRKELRVQQLKSKQSLRTGLQDSSAPSSRRASSRTPSSRTPSRTLGSQLETMNSYQLELTNLLKELTRINSEISKNRGLEVLIKQPKHRKQHADKLPIILQRLEKLREEKQPIIDEIKRIRSLLTVRTKLMAGGGNTRRRTTRRRNTRRRNTRRRTTRRKNTRRRNTRRKNTRRRNTRRKNTRRRNTRR